MEEYEERRDKRREWSYSYGNSKLVPSAVVAVYHPCSSKSDECAVQVRGALWRATPSPACVTGLCNYKEGAVWSANPSPASTLLCSTRAVSAVTSNVQFTQEESAC